MTASHASHPNRQPSSSWLDSLTSLCAPLTACFGRRRSKSIFTSASISWPLGRTSDQDLLIAKGDEKRDRVHTDEGPASQALSIDIGSAPPASIKEKPRRSFASGRTMNTIKKRFKSDGSSQRPRISGPSEFRHVESASFQFPHLEPTAPVPQPPQRRPARRSSFRPLELSIYMQHKHMSPILPHFEFPASVALPEPAQLHERLDDEYQLLRGRSNSSTPFHLPRRPGTSQSPSGASDRAPAIPVRSQARARAHTSPELDFIKARVAGAMNEVDRLQRQIDDVIERQSLYVSSRPSTAHSMALTLPDPESMPSVPALPPPAPSFKERLSEFDRPRTAPLKTAFEISNRSQEFEHGKTSSSTPTRRQHDHPLPPPLPLVLRPPLRKKKSFSRVSSWLFPSSHHERDVSLDSITNLPRPVKGTEGFYQCVAPGGAERHSFDTVGTVTTWDSEEEQQTVQTTLSPGSTPVAKAEGPLLERTATFGRGQAAR